MYRQEQLSLSSAASNIAASGMRRWVVLFLLIAALVTVFVVRTLLAASLQLPRLFEIFEALTILIALGVMVRGRNLLTYIEPGKPWQNGKDERFNGTVRDECLNMHSFASVAEACVRLNTFRDQYNTERPHSRLSYLTPLAFKMAWYEAQAKQLAPHIQI